MVLHTVLLFSLLSPPPHHAMQQGGTVSWRANIIMWLCRMTGGGGGGKVYPRTGHGGPEGEMYSSTLSLTSALDGVGCQRTTSAAVPPTKDPSYRSLGGPQGRPGRVRKISPANGAPFPGRPARSEWLYRLSYPGPQWWRGAEESRMSVKRLWSTKRKMQCSLVNGTKLRTIVSAKLHDVTCHKTVMA